MPACCARYFKRPVAENGNFTELGTGPGLDCLPVVYDPGNFPYSYPLKARLFKLTTRFVEHAEPAKKLKHWVADNAEFISSNDLGQNFSCKVLEVVRNISLTRPSTLFANSVTTCLRVRSGFYFNPGPDTQWWVRIRSEILGWEKRVVMCLHRTPQVGLIPKYTAFGPSPDGPSMRLLKRTRNDPSRVGAPLHLSRHRDVARDRGTPKSAIRMPSIISGNSR